MFASCKSGHQILGESLEPDCVGISPNSRRAGEDLSTATPPSRGRHSPRTGTASRQGQRYEADASRQKVDTDQQADGPGC
jgi:hypothetical protein